MKPNMPKVLAALEKYAPKRIVTVSKPKLPPVDAAIRKELKAHGNPCSGFMHPHFNNLHQ